MVGDQEGIEHNEPIMTKLSYQNNRSFPLGVALDLHVFILSFFGCKLKRSGSMMEQILSYNQWSHVDKKGVSFQLRATVVLVRCL